jgi:hypothetical protein
MPFTLAHAAAALPFRRLRPVWPALIIGTFAPDFEYFIRLSDEDHGGHHFPDVLIFTLPLALLVLWLFEAYVKGPVVELLPTGLQRRLQSGSKPLPSARTERFVVMLGWLVIGMTTHLLWDSLTHPYSWVWEHWGWLRESLYVPWHGVVMMSKVLQLVSTVLGIVTLLVWMAAWYRNTPPAPRLKIRGLSSRRKAMTVGVMLGLSILAGSCLAAWRLSQGDPVYSLVPWVITVVEAVTLVLWGLILLYGVARVHASSIVPKPKDCSHQS